MINKIQAFKQKWEPWKNLYLPPRAPRLPKGLKTFPARAVGTAMGYCIRNEGSFGMPHNVLRMPRMKRMSFGCCVRKYPPAGRATWLSQPNTAPPRPLKGRRKQCISVTQGSDGSRTGCQIHTAPTLKAMPLVKFWRHIKEECLQLPEKATKDSLPFSNYIYVVKVTFLDTHSQNNTSEQTEHKSKQEPPACLPRSQEWRCAKHIK